MGNWGEKKTTLLIIGHNYFTPFTTGFLGPPCSKGLMHSNQRLEAKKQPASLVAFVLPHRTQVVWIIFLKAPGFYLGRFLRVMLREYPISRISETHNPCIPKDPDMS